MYYSNIPWEVFFLIGMGLVVFNFISFSLSQDNANVKSS